jgi:periplasmic protein TonB
MFNNLIESTSHAREFKRRGSFLLFTTLTYMVLIAIGGVASIYAYDAHLGAQSTEYEITIIPVAPPAEAPPEEIRNTIHRPSDSDNQPTRSTRIELIDSTSNPNNPPEKVGTVAPSVPPARPDSVIGTTNVDPPGPPASNRGVPGSNGNTPLVNIVDPPPPPPAPTPTPVQKIVKISVVLNSRALELPKPVYPAMAKQIRLSGTVNVQVLIDETGKVIQAKATGHPLLIVEAQRAAMRARFSPTTIGDQPVKVSGVITYNFVMP